MTQPSSSRPAVLLSGGSTVASGSSATWTRSSMVGFDGLRHHHHHHHHRHHLVLLLLLALLPPPASASAAHEATIVVAAFNQAPYSAVADGVAVGTRFTLGKNNSNTQGCSAAVTAVEGKCVRFPLVDSLSASAARVNALRAPWTLTWQYLVVADARAAVAAVESGAADLALPIKAGLLDLDNTTASSAAAFAQSAKLLYVPSRLVNFVYIALADLLKLWPALLALFLCSLGTGLTFYLAEHGRVEPEFYGPGPSSWRWFWGILAGSWFSLVTLTTVGYGDKYPKTWTGRLSATLLIISGLVITSLLSGTIVATLTSLSSATTSAEALLSSSSSNTAAGTGSSSSSSSGGGGAPVAILAGGSVEQAFASNDLTFSSSGSGSGGGSGVATTTFGTLAAACTALGDATVDALIADAMEISLCVDQLKASSSTSSSTGSSASSTSSMTTSVNELGTLQFSTLAEYYEVIYAADKFDAWQAIAAWPRVIDPEKEANGLSKSLLTFKGRAKNVYLTEYVHTASGTSSGGGGGSSSSPAAAAASSAESIVELESSATYCATTITVVLGITFAFSLLLLTIRLAADVISNRGRCCKGARGGSAMPPPSPPPAQLDQAQQQKLGSEHQVEMNPVRSSGNIAPQRFVALLARHDEERAALQQRHAAELQELIAAEKLA